MQYISPLYCWYTPYPIFTLHTHTHTHICAHSCWVKDGWRRSGSSCCTEGLESLLQHCHYYWKKKRRQPARRSWPDCQNSLKYTGCSCLLLVKQYLQLTIMPQRREDMTSCCSANLMTFQGQESWMQLQGSLYDLSLNRCIRFRLSWSRLNWLLWSPRKLRLSAASSTEGESQEDILIAKHLQPFQKPCTPIAPITTLSIEHLV